MFIGKQCEYIEHTWYSTSPRTRDAVCTHSERARQLAGSHLAVVSIGATLCVCVCVYVCAGIVLEKAIIF
jgi:hypothetical protein